MRNPDTLPPADALPPEWGPDGDLLRQALSGGGTGLPTVSDDLLADQARLEGLLVGGEAAGLLKPEAGDLDLLADLIVAQAQVAAGTTRAPSPAVLEAVGAAFDAAPVSGLVEAGGVGSAFDATRFLERPASVSGAGPRVLGARASRSGRWLAAAAAVLVACFGTWIVAHSAGSPSDPGRAHEPSALGSSGGLNATELASLNQTLSGPVGEGASGGVGTRAQVAPFVEARLWRRVAGRALRGGEGLGLRQGAGAEAGASRAAGDAPADVVLSWLPDAASGAAARLRVHVTGPQGLVVALPDLGIEARLPGRAAPDPAEGAGASASGLGRATYVDLELPGGWAGRLPERELRLAFRWPASGGTSFPSSSARFTGVSLASRHAVEGS